MRLQVIKILVTRQQQVRECQNVVRVATILVFALAVVADCIYTPQIFAMITMQKLISTLTLLRAEPHVFAMMAAKLGVRSICIW